MSMVVFEWIERVTGGKQMLIKARSGQARVHGEANAAGGCGAREDVAMRHEGRARDGRAGCRAMPHCG